MDEEKVVSIHGYDLPTRESNGALVERLKKLLEMAEAGEVVGFAGVSMFADEGTQRVLVGTVHTKQLGALQLVMHDMSRLMLED